MDFLTKLLESLSDMVIDRWEQVGEWAAVALVVLVIVATGPNPTNGQIFHLPPENVYLVDQKVEDVMRSILSCGSGSGPLIQELEQKGTIAKGGGGPAI